MAREFKDSGIEWIGRIPKDWKVMPHKRLMRKIKELCPEYKGEDIISLTMNGVIVRDLNAGGKMPTSFDGYQYVHPGNLLMCLFDIDVTPRCVGLIRNEGLTSPAYSQFVLYEGVNGPYYNYLLRYMDDEKCLLHLSKNLRSSLTEDDFGQIPTVFPSLFEQKKIAEYLDGKCGEIDSLISLQEQMIAQLTDYKQAIITEAVTKGLDPNAQLVPSGIDWIELMPKGWKLIRFYYSSWIRARLGWKGLKAEEYTEIGYPFLSAFNIKNNKLDWSNINYINQERYDESPEIKLNLGDILLVKDGAGIGKCARVDSLPLGESTVNSSLAVITPKNYLNYRYLYYYLQSNPFWSIINLLLVGMGVPHLTQTNMKNIKMPLPPLDEQLSIADFLDAKCSEIDDLITLKQNKIEILKDYKKSLIYECVTGKIEVV